VSPFLSLVEASFRLGEGIFFERTSWVFQRHEHWAIIGPNSSGKSLFSEALRGQLPIVHGQVRYHFRPVPGLTAEESIGHIAFEDRKHEVHDTVVQSRWNSIEEEGALRVRDFLSYERVNNVNPFEITERHKMARPRFERRVRWAIGLLHLRPFLDRTLLSLSNGETQRVQLARALAHPMRLLVLDEPFVGLDSATRTHFHRVLERLMATPLRALLIITRLEDLPQAITHILCVHECQCVAVGPRDRILSDPQVRNLLSRTLPLRVSLAGRLYRKRRPRLGPPTINSPSNGSAIKTTHSLAPAQHKGKSLVQMRNVTVRYGGVTLLHAINWTIRPGESWALLGSNGSGKTTLLSLILGDNPQVYSNEIEVFGRRRGTGESIWELKKHIGWISPELDLHFDDSLTCVEAVVSGFHETTGLFESPTTRQKTVALRLLNQLQMQGWAEAPLYELSPGLQRMVFLARALVKKPRLLILDEPCQGMDASHRDLFLKAIDPLIAAGSVTAIFVSHRMDEIPKSITRVLRLSAGRATFDVI
jgi:molybdate transport system ATP-binding protein